ncbi:MAG: thioredoxin domain-containing protein [Alphaproteobacteria bacterium]|nr:thioredoxin domain-containing protein [Alphaproteobacteria bacterium]
MASNWGTGVVGGVIGALVASGVMFGAAGLGYFPAPSDQQFRTWLLKHPSIIYEMRDQAEIDAFNAEERGIQDKVDKLGIKTFLDPKLAYVAGPKDAKKTLVEFFDYNCAHCRHNFPILKKFYEKHKGDTQFAFVELPIFGDASNAAARSALAARHQDGKYIPFHFAMMEQKGAIGTAETVESANKAGLDLNRLMADLKDPGIAKQLASAHALAQRIGLTGTPLFIINGKVHSGEVTEAELKQMTES